MCALDRSWRHGDRTANPLEDLLGEFEPGRVDEPVVGLPWQGAELHALDLPSDGAIVAVELLGGVALAGLFAFAGWRALSGDITVGELVGIGPPPADPTAIVPLAMAVVMGASSALRNCWKS